MTHADLSSDDSRSVPEGWRPNPWLAALLGILAPLGVLYAGRFRLALYYLLVAMLTGVIDSLGILQGIGAPSGISLTTMLIIVCAIHSVYLAKSLPPRIRRPWYSRWYGLIGVYASIFLSAFLMRAIFFEPFIYPLPTMLPAIEPHSRILVQKWGYGYYSSLGLTVLRADVIEKGDIQRGEVFAFEHPEDRSLHLVARVIGLPGDSIDLKDNEITVNGSPLKKREKIVNRDFQYSLVVEELDGTSYEVFRPNVGPTRSVRVIVPARSYLFVGDNRIITIADRIWTIAPQDHIIGKVVATW